MLYNNKGGYQGDTPTRPDPPAPQVQNNIVSHYIMLNKLISVRLSILKIKLFLILFTLEIIA